MSTFVLKYDQLEEPVKFQPSLLKLRLKTTGTTGLQDYGGHILRGFTASRQASANDTRITG